MREEALGLDAPELLEQGESQHLRVGGPLQGLVAPRSWVEGVVGIVSTIQKSTITASSVRARPEVW
jgi:hypothetical protein